MIECPRGLDASDKFLEYIAELRETWAVRPENRSQTTAGERDSLTS